jgi:hypothetical protein
MRRSRLVASSVSVKRRGRRMAKNNNHTHKTTAASMVLL